MGLVKRFSGFIALRNTSAPATPTSEVVIWSNAGVATVLQPDGTSVPIVNAAGATTQLWTGGNAATTYSNNTPAVRCGGAS